MQTVEIKVPDLGESISQATLGKWHKQPGETTLADSLLVELETDKVTLEVYAPSNGTIVEILAQSGSTVEVGQVLAKFTPSEESPAKISPAPINPEPPVTPNQPDLAAKKTKAQTASIGQREELRAPMSRLRQRIGERLKEAQNTAAILTTFNEVDMSAITQTRNLYQEKFTKTHGIKLSFVPFFVHACVKALGEQPIINSCIDNSEIITKNYCDIGVAVSTPNGLVVPIIRNAETLSLAASAKVMDELAKKARDGKLSVDEMSGGTFTITNGGVFGSLLSTPILNPPQSAILGLHKIQERPVVVNGQIVIRPMMYLALSYDHRLIDGKEAVTFLVTIKEYLENPGRFLLEL